MMVLNEPSEMAVGPWISQWFFGTGMGWDGMGCMDLLTRLLRALLYGANKLKLDATHRHIYEKVSCRLCLFSCPQQLNR